MTKFLTPFYLKKRSTKFSAGNIHHSFKIQFFSTSKYLRNGIVQESFKSYNLSFRIWQCFKKFFNSGGFFESEHSIDHFWFWHLFWLSKNHLILMKLGKVGKRILQDVFFWLPALVLPGNERKFIEIVLEKRFFNSKGIVLI